MHREGRAGRRAAPTCTGSRGLGLWHVGPYVSALARAARHDCGCGGRLARAEGVRGWPPVQSARALGSGGGGGTYAWRACGAQVCDDCKGGAPRSSCNTIPESQPLSGSPWSLDSDNDEGLPIECSIQRCTRDDDDEPKCDGIDDERGAQPQLLLQQSFRSSMELMILRK